MTRRGTVHWFVAGAGWVLLPLGWFACGSLRSTNTRNRQHKVQAHLPARLASLPQRSLVAASTRHGLQKRVGAHAAPVGFGRETAPHGLDMPTCPWTRGFANTHYSRTLSTTHFTVHLSARFLRRAGARLPLRHAYTARASAYRDILPVRSMAAGAWLFVPLRERRRTLRARA